ncbi:MAG: KOW domain-containing RNA-binding protein [Clostridiales bacterium]|nr:KOW domain-containing RNA-binding protein [Clostridiales bacterium]
MKFRLARSKAGHDKDRLYVIVGEDGDFVSLADGVRRTVGHPKRKKRKHIQVIGNISPAVEEPLTRGGDPGDLEIKRALKLYQEEENVKSRCN